MLNEAIKSGKTSIVFLTGAGGAGKTQVLTNNRNIDFSHAGIVFNSAFNNYFKLDKTIKRAQEKGMKDVTVIAVYNDALTSFKNTVYRGRQTGRFLSLQYFVDYAFILNANKITLLLNQHPEINLVTIDNSENNGGKIVSAKEAQDWSYAVNEKLMYDLLKFIENEYKQKKLDGKQISAIGRDILKIKELTSERVKQIANRIASEIFNNVFYEERRNWAFTLGINEQGGSKAIDENGEPKVVKSATNNMGGFSKENSNIYLSITSNIESQFDNIRQNLKILNKIEETFKKADIEVQYVTSKKGVEVYV